MEGGSKARYHSFPSQKTTFQMGGSAGDLSSKMIEKQTIMLLTGLGRNEMVRTPFPKDG